MTYKEKIKEDFKRIKELGYVPCTRPNNKDGGIGNTYEDLLGVVENNLSSADYLGYEIKSQRKLTGSYISLFSKSPSFPVRGNTYLRKTYGEIRDENHPEIKKLYASIFGHRLSKVYNKYYMNLSVDRIEERLYLYIYDLNENLLDTVYWTFEVLRKASLKMKNLLVVYADLETGEDNSSRYHFNKGEIYENFSFENFLNCIENGVIMFDMRMGVYSSGKNYGKSHDHGSGFRIKSQNFKDLYKHYEVI